MIDRPLRILITNIGIAERTGTEVVTMDLACGLAKLGHFPMIWAPRLDAAVAGPVLAAGIPAVSRLEDLPYHPDVIHGQNHLETIAALRRFPRIPAIFVCHSGYWWHDAPPRHLAIRRYVAVDEFCRERLRSAWWIDSNRVAMVWNAVDMSRHWPRPPLPSRPQRALIFSHYAGPNTHVEPIQEACRCLRVELDIIGSGVSNPSWEPERLLPSYDLVFAKARCAMEAISTGCAVILCDTAGLGTIVTSANVRELRPWNFGIRVLERPLDPGLIAEEIRRYDPGDAAHVSAYMRENARLEDAVQHYLALYRSVLNEATWLDDEIDWHPASRPLQIEDQEGLKLRLLTVPASAAPQQHLTFDIALDNGTRVPIATSAPWPCMLTYRWLRRQTREIVVEHGFRTILQPPAWPGTESTYSMRAIAPSQEGDYVLRATILQEGWRWLDHLSPAVFAEAPVRVATL
jgi:hypothetical protein